MMATVVDSISNTNIARVNIAKVDGDIVVLHNAHQEAQAVLNLEKQYKLISDNGEICGAIQPQKVSKSYITIKIDRANGIKDKRKFLRVPCDRPGRIYATGAMVDCIITELAYGSCVINCREELFTQEGTTVQLEVNGQTLCINGMIEWKKAKKDEDDDIWITGNEYIVVFNERDNLEQVMEELYGALLILLRQQREKEYENNMFNFA